ncbi:MAG: T9SS type A sorting domain-containing protein [Prevotellaceae bacterium]|jgi:hypothetical protein|nr:T9SS type A sorting domain-containing protein [Prevotellaceae bacterium]
MKQKLLVSIFGAFLALNFAFAGDVLPAEDWQQQAFQSSAGGELTNNEGGGFTLVCGATNQGIWKEVCLKAGEAYSLSGTFTYQGNNTWIQVHLTKLTPVEVLPEVTNENDVWYFFDRTTWSGGEVALGGTATGDLTGTGVSEGNSYTPTASGKYYLIFKIGSQATANVTFSDIALTGEEHDCSIQEGVELTNADAFKAYTIGSTIQIEGSGNVEIYSATGILVEKGVAETTFSSKSLMQGVYIVNVDGAIKKVLVK